MQIKTEIETEIPERLLVDISRRGIQNAADGLSGMVGQTCTITEPIIHSIDIMEIPQYLGSPEEEVVGVYLRVGEGLPIQFILLLPIQQALDLTDMLMQQPQGTTTGLDLLSQSALAEIGNLTGSRFLNAIADEAEISLRPTTPGVMIDMICAMMNVIVASIGDLSQRVMLVQTAFEFPNRQCKIDFWAIPNLETINSLVKVIDSHHV